MSGWLPGGNRLPHARNFMRRKDFIPRRKGSFVRWRDMRMNIAPWSISLVAHQYAKEAIHLYFRCSFIFHSHGLHAAHFRHAFIVAMFTLFSIHRWESVASKQPFCFLFCSALCQYVPWTKQFQKKKRWKMSAEIYFLPGSTLEFANRNEFLSHFLIKMMIQLLHYSCWFASSVDQHKRSICDLHPHASG